MTECDLKRNGQMLASPRKRPRRNDMSKVTVVVGAQWGDEGKGKVVDMLATDADIVYPCQSFDSMALTSKCGVSSKMDQQLTLYVI
jgi:hypothetical protein